jgi:tetratricopeptide (TPR) repeat protein
MRATVAAPGIALTVFFAASCAAPSRDARDAANGASGAPCDAAESEQERVWNAATRAQILSTLAGLGPSYALRAARDTAAYLDAVGAAWTRAKKAACVSGQRAAAARAGSGGTPAVQSPEIRCFDAALATERAAVKTLLASDRSTLPRSFDVVEAVSMAVDRCQHAEAVAAFAADAAPNPLGTAATLRAAADTAVLAGKQPDALRLAEQALSHVERVLGPDSRETLSYELWVARIEGANGEHAHAASRYARVIGRAERTLGPRDGRLAGAHLSLGQTYAVLAAFPEAEREERLGLEVAVRTFGGEHPVSGDAHHALALLFHQRKQHAEALVEGERALSIRRAAFGDVSLPVAESSFLLGDVLGALGKHDAALEAYTGALSARVRLLGAEHREVGEAHLAIGRTLEALGRHTEALAELQRALSIEEDSPGAKVPDLAAAHGRIGVVLRAARRYDDALFEHHLAVQLLKESLGPEDPAVAAELGLIASILMEQGKFDDAADTYREVLRLNEGAFGKEHPSIGNDHRHLGLALAALGQSKEARSELTTALGIYQKASPIDEGAVQELNEALAKLGEKPAKVERARKK